MALTYKNSGVNYRLIDPFKKLAQKNGMLTSSNILNTDFKEISQSRGESAFVTESSDCYYAFVIEGLGTKNLVADEVSKITGKSYYDTIAQDTVAMIVNDLITVGARPLIINAYWAVGNSNWFDDKKRAKDLVIGWKKACNLSSAIWGSGETPVLKDIVYPETIDLAGSAYGIIKPKKRLILGDKIEEGDAIILLESSGIHANGLTLARSIVNKLSDGFATKLPNGKIYGEELLTPTIIYSRLINDLLDNGVDIHYMVNITGHGWRKLMRAKKSFIYIIEQIPPVQPIFKFIQKNGSLSNKEMYATFNMGAGFAIYIPSNQIDRVLAMAEKHKIKAWIAGKIKKGAKQVIIKPLNIIFQQKELNIRTA